MDSKILKIVNKSPNPNPSYANVTDSGLDLYAWIEPSNTSSTKTSVDSKYYIELESLDRCLVHTGIYMELPENTEVQIRPKSGRAIKEGLGVLNSPGTVN